MKKSILIKYIFIMLILAIQGCKSSPIAENDTLLTDDSGKNWQYFELQNPITIKIINHLPSSGLCGNLAFASVTIGRTETGDTIRILDLCNTANYLENQLVKVTPEQKPNFNVLLPNRKFRNPKNGKLEFYSLDSRTVKTAYGNLPK